ncbi:MAG: hypothetical protein AAF518_04825 [Spirochaetota bacterium]
MDNLLQKTIEEFGYPDIESFARHHAIEILEHKLSNYKEKDLKYQKKYDCSFADLKQKEHQPISETEEDYIEWQSIVHSKDYVENRIQALKNHPKKQDWWDNIDEKEKRAIEEGLEDYRNGNLVSHEKVTENVKRILES